MVGSDSLPRRRKRKTSQKIMRSLQRRIRRIRRIRTMVRHQKMLEAGFSTVIMTSVPSS
jgi:hypothetical protein